MSTTVVVVSAGSAAFAFAASALWLWSARIRTPERFSIHVVRGTSVMQQPMGGSIDAEFIGTAHSKDLVALASGLRRQSELSGWAAVCAALAAALQGLLVFIPS